MIGVNALILLAKKVGTIAVTAVATI